MTQDEIHILAVVTKFILLPGIGFLAGFTAQWYLQERKSRDELLQALASQRADALRELWTIAALQPKVTALKGDVVVPSDLREKANAKIMKWYIKKGGALFLSWHATRLVFQLLDTLRSENATKNHLEIAVTALRTRLKRDCGLYSYWDAKRQLIRPRQPPWSSNKTVKND